MHHTHQAQCPPFPLPIFLPSSSSPLLADPGIRNHLLEHDFLCLNCNLKMSPDKLVINKNLRMVCLCAGGASLHTPHPAATHHTITYTQQKTLTQHTHIPQCTYTHTHTTQGTYTHAHTTVHVYTHTHTTQGTYTHAHTTVHVYTHTHTTQCTYTQAHTTVHIYTHTHHTITYTTKNTHTTHTPHSARIHMHTPHSAHTQPYVCLFYSMPRSFAAVSVLELSCRPAKK